MAAQIRIFSFNGVVTAPKSSGSMSYATDSIGMLKYPYSAREAITANDSAPQSTSTDLTAEGTEMVLVQIQHGKAAHIEINPPNRSVPADVSSPIFTGDVTFRIGKNWTISVLEHELV